MAINTVSSSTVVAYFSTESAAETAVSQLRDAGFASNQIGVASRSSQLENQGSYAGAETANEVYPANTGNATNTSTTGQNTTPRPAGQGHESAWDKVRNFFSSDPVEPYADEHSRGDFASHEITTDDYSRDDIHQSLSGMSVPEERSKYFGHRFGKGDQGAVVTVNATGREEEAQRILSENGGDLGTESGNYDYSDADTTTATPAAGQQRIQLLGEVLRVHKDRISRGEVRIRKEVITETQTVEVPVSREELVIERTVPVDAHSATGRVGESSEIRIPLSEEIASADKDTVVREEVSVGKRAVQSVSNVGDSISHEELVVEDSTKSGERRSA